MLFDYNYVESLTYLSNRKIWGFGVLGGFDGPDAVELNADHADDKNADQSEDA